MIQKIKHTFIRILYVAIDLACICLSIYLACAIRPQTLPQHIIITPYNIFINQQNPYRFIFVFWAIVTFLFLTKRPLYQTRREVLEGVEIGLLFRSVISATMVVILAIFSLKYTGFPRSVLFIGSGLMLVFLSIWRILKRFLVQYLVAHGYNNFNVLIIGAGKVGTTLAREIKKRPALGLNVAGYLDDFKISSGEIKILGKISDFVKVARNEFVDKVFITIHHDCDVFARLLEQAKSLGVAIRVVPQGFNLISGEFEKYNIGIIPILEYQEATPLKTQFGKRIFDMIFTMIGLLILWPVFLGLAFLIKKDSPGPVFYRSRRYGRSGRIFHMYKFRSMAADADRMIDQLRDKNEVDGPIFKIKNDPRVTKFGQFLRKYSLDELPQLFNVLKGDMSLVGPRPLPIDQIIKEDLRQLKRLEVRPGITGLWQIRGRSDITFERLVKWDMWYISNWSFWLDLNILFQTLPVVLKGRGAY